VVRGVRNKDLRLQDNRALANASATAASLDIPLIVLHIFSPSDWKSHDVSARRIDFQLRALHLLQPALAKLHVPLYTITYDDRKEIPTKLAAQLKEWNASHVFANIEYEVDELRRDEKVVRDSIEARTSGEGWHGTASFLADFCVIKPFSVLTKVRLRPPLLRGYALTTLRYSKGNLMESSDPGTRTGSRRSNETLKTTLETPERSSPTRHPPSNILSSLLSSVTSCPPPSLDSSSRRKTRRR
jgi:deoxyribodipyrimidine photolyase